MPEDSQATPSLSESLESGAWVRAHAPAKLNLFLEIEARRADGFHELDTLMVALQWGDELRLRVTAGPMSLKVLGPCASADIPSDERNLVWRAAHLWVQRALELELLPSEIHFEIELHKHVPSQAGLGGGSADAVAALLACEDALGIQIGPQELQQLCANLGSDCAFFAEARDTGIGRCTGRGELVEPWQPLPRRWNCLVLCPKIQSPTPAVFGSLEFPLGAGLELTAASPGFFSNSELALRAACFNRLEEAALRAVPALARLRSRLDERGFEHLRLSGSGSSFYGLYAREEDARGDAARLSEALEGFEACTIQMTQLSHFGARLLADPAKPGS